MQITSNLRRLPLEGAKNTRDLGGYPCPGGVTRWHTFVRSDNPRALTPKDLEFLKGYGVTTAVDLRRDDEAAHAPSALATAPGFTVHGVSLNDDLHNINYEGDMPGTMSGLYIKLLDDSRAEIVRVMALMAEAEGGVLFHCAVGKDRTGVIAMLLLDLAGVDEKDIIADYAITDIYMDEMLEQQAAVFKMAIPDYVLRSVPASMARVLRHLREQYGDARRYLESCGLPPETMQKLLDKLVAQA